MPCSSLTPQAWRWTEGRLSGCLFSGATMLAFMEPHYSFSGDCVPGPLPVLRLGVGQALSSPVPQGMLAGRCFLTNAQVGQPLWDKLTVVWIPLVQLAAPWPPSTGRDCPSSSPQDGFVMVIRGAEFPCNA